MLETVLDEVRWQRRPRRPSPRAIERKQIPNRIISFPCGSSERVGREGNTHEPTEDVLDLDSEFGHLQIEREVVVVRS